MNINAENMEQLISKLVKNNSLIFPIFYVYDMEDPEFPIHFFKIFDVNITYDDISDEYKMSEDDFNELFPKEK